MNFNDATISYNRVSSGPSPHSNNWQQQHPNIVPHSKVVIAALMAARYALRRRRGLVATKNIIWRQHIVAGMNANDDLKSGFCSFPPFLCPRSNRSELGKKGRGKQRNPANTSRNDVHYVITDTAGKRPRRREPFVPLPQSSTLYCVRGEERNKMAAGKQGYNEIFPQIRGIYRFPR